MYGFCRTFLGADTAPLAVIVVNFHGRELGNDPFGAIHPAKMTGIPSGLGRDTFGAVYLGS
jgi:hypothetical protein